MCVRGVEKVDSFTVTTAFCGSYATDAALRAEFLAAVGHRR